MTDDPYWSVGDHNRCPLRRNYKYMGSVMVHAWVAGVFRNVKRGTRVEPMADIFYGRLGQPPVLLCLFFLFSLKYVFTFKRRTCPLNTLCLRRWKNRGDMRKTYPKQSLHRGKWGLFLFNQSINQPITDQSCLISRATVYVITYCCKPSIGEASRAWCRLQTFKLKVHLLRLLADLLYNFM